MAELEGGAAQHRAEPPGGGLDVLGRQRQLRRVHGLERAHCASCAITRAVATAATPSPRPVSPSPSAVVPETDTVAPAARLSTWQASSRRSERRGRLAIAWLATLPVETRA